MMPYLTTTWGNPSSPYSFGEEARSAVEDARERIAKVIGAEAQLPDSEVSVRQLLEQIVAKTGLPPFLLGLSWSSTERMSSQQADVLTSELEAYRRILTPVIKKICTAFLRSRGYACNPEIIWDNITLQDEVELGRARLYNAQAAKLEAENEKRGE